MQEKIPAGSGQNSGEMIRKKENEMAVNPMAMMKAADSFRKFKAAHPKVAAFFKAARDDIREGTVIEVSIVTPDGEKKTTNMRISAQDAENLQGLLNLRK